MRRWLRRSREGGRKCPHCLWGPGGGRDGDGSRFNTFWDGQVGVERLDKENERPESSWSAAILSCRWDTYSRRCIIR